jgi:hypothetical protein
MGRRIDGWIDKIGNVGYWIGYWIGKERIA